MRMGTEARVPRRTFLASLPALLLAASARRGWPLGAIDGSQERHPTPRRGIDASRVLAEKELDDDPDVRQAFALVRQIPQIADGIRCSCGCAEMKDFHSLLSCFEGDGMAQHCEVCRESARLAHRLHRAGKTLGQIRAAIDAQHR